MPLSPHEYAACDGAMAQHERVCVCVSVLEKRRLKWAARNNECNTSLLGDDDTFRATECRLISFHLFSLNYWCERAKCVFQADPVVKRASI